MIRLRTAVAITGAALAATIPATASAATAPVVIGPTAAQLAKSTPGFSWTLGPAGEVVNYISIRPTSAGTNEEPQTVRSLAGATSATSLGTLNAGTYGWSAGWTTAAGVSPYEAGVTAEQSFTVAPRVTKVTIGTIRQDNSQFYLGLGGQYSTNIPFVNVGCKVFNGRKLVHSETLKREDANSADTTSQYFCSLLRVPEKLDGLKLRAEVTVFLGKTKLVTSKAFTAK